MSHLLILHDQTGIVCELLISLTIQISNYYFDFIGCFSSIFLESSAISKLRVQRGNAKIVESMGLNDMERFGDEDKSGITLFHPNPKSRHKTRIENLAAQSLNFYLPTESQQ